jgi:hypothetical protein
MMNQQALHQEGRKPEERGLLIGSVRTGWPKSFDLDQFEIELMDHGGGLERVTRALGTHAGRGDAPKLGIEKLDQAARGFMVAMAKPCHQAGYGFGLKRGGCCGHLGTQFNSRTSSRAARKSKTFDTIRRRDRIRLGQDVFALAESAANPGTRRSRLLD